MTAEVRLVDADELRQRIEAERINRVPTSQRVGLGTAIAVLDAMPSVSAPKGWTRDEVLAELAKHPDNVCEYLSPNTGNWVEVDGTGGWVEGWKNPDVARPNVRVVRSTPDPEWVPLTKLVGRTIHGRCGVVVRDPSALGGIGWRWYDGERWRPFPDGTLNLDDGMVAVRPEGTPHA